MGLAARLRASMGPVPALAAPGLKLSERNAVGDRSGEDAVVRSKRRWTSRVVFWMRWVRFEGVAGPAERIQG